MRKMIFFYFYTNNTRKGTNSDEIDLYVNFKLYLERYHSKKNGIV